MVLEENTLPKSYYQEKKILFLMGMEYQKIYACLNDCILYRNEFEEMPNCPGCGVSRYKVKDDDQRSSDESTKKGPPSKGVMLSSDHSKVQKTLHGMQMGEVAMECSTIRLIPFSERRLIVYALNYVHA